MCVRGSSFFLGGALKEGKGARPGGVMRGAHLTATLRVAGDGFRGPRNSVYQQKTSAVQGGTHRNPIHCAFAQGLAFSPASAPQYC